MKVWESSKELWKHSPAARVPTAFLVLRNFHSCLYNSIETRYMFSISYDDITSRLCKARAVFGKLSGVWKSSILSKSTKIRIFKSNVRAVLLYGCESWRMTKGDEARLDTFQHKCLRRLLKSTGLCACPMKKCAGEPTLRPSAN